MVNSQYSPSKNCLYTNPNRGARISCDSDDSQTSRLYSFFRCATRGGLVRGQALGSWTIKQGARMAGWLRRLKRLSIRRRTLAELFPDREFHYRTEGRI